jgi:hypothetical protein
MGLLIDGLLKLMDIGLKASEEFEPRCLYLANDHYLELLNKKKVFLTTSKIKVSCFLLNSVDVRTNERLDYSKICEIIPEFAKSKENTEHNTNKIVLSKETKVSNNDYILWPVEYPEKIYVLTTHFQYKERRFDPKGYFMTFKEYICGHQVDHKYRKIRSYPLSPFIGNNL